MCTSQDATASHQEVSRLQSRRGFLRTTGAREYHVKDSPPRQPADALDTAPVGYDFLSSVRF